MATDAAAAHQRRERATVASGWATVAAAWATIDAVMRMGAQSKAVRTVARNTSDGNCPSGASGHRPG